MVEKKETIAKNVVIFALYDGQLINLEERIEPGHRFTGYTIIPGGVIEHGESEEEALQREVREEFSVEVTEFKRLGDVIDKISESVSNFGNVYLVSKWDGEVSNPEMKNRHIQTTLSEARVICNHPVTQQVLDLIDKHLLESG